VPRDPVAGPVSDDFPFGDELCPINAKPPAAMCSSASRFDMTQLDHAGLAGISPLNAVTFVENPDTDISEPVIWNRILGYAYILTAEGYPCVFYKDYSNDPGCYGLKPWIDDLIWIHENLAFGTTLARYKDYQTIVYERQSHPNLLVGLNNDAGNPKTVTVQTGFGPGVRLHDYTGHEQDVWTDGDGVVTITIPVNHNGLSYVAYSRTGYAQGFTPAPRPVAQTFEGAADLDIAPLTHGDTVTLDPVWVAIGTPAQAQIALADADWAATTSLRIEIAEPSGQTLASQEWEHGQPRPGPLRVNTQQSGWHTLRLSAELSPAASGSFSLTVSYTSTQQLEGA
jgi:alpha-amylase